jgi:hypothetical protein
VRLAFIIYNAHDVDLMTGNDLFAHACCPARNIEFPVCTSAPVPPRHGYVRGILSEFDEPSGMAFKPSDPVDDTERS